MGREIVHERSREDVKADLAREAGFRDFNRYVTSPFQLSEAPMTVTHSKSLTTRRKQQKRKKTLARIAKVAEKMTKQGANKSRSDTAGEKGNG